MTSKVDTTASCELRWELERWMKETGDRRATTDDDRWDKYPYFGEPAKSPQSR